MIRDSAWRRIGLTPIQLLILLALILVFIGLLLPIFARLNLTSRRAESMNNLRQLALASISYADTFRTLPPAVGKPNHAEHSGTAHYFILPFIEQQALFNKAGGFKGSPWVEGIAATYIPVFVDRQDTSVAPQFVYKDWLATTSYPCNWLVLRDGKQAFPASIPDGTSNTLMFAQRYQMCNGTPTAWGYADLYYWAPMFAYHSVGMFQSLPSPEDCDPALAQSIGASSIMTCFCDGSARAIRPPMRSIMWYYLCDPADGNVLDADIF